MHTNDSVLKVWEVFCFSTAGRNYGGCGAMYSSIYRTTCPICRGSDISVMETGLTTDGVSHYYNARGKEVVFN